MMGILLNEEFEFNSHLNPSLFDGDKLKEDVRNALLKIADTFVDDLKSNDIPLNVVDYWLLGSNAAYNYNEKSDIDIHIIVNNEGIECDKNILNLLYNYAKSSFNNNHDIKVKGHEVELYIEGIDSTAASNGIYSLKFDLWVKKPYPPDLEFSFDPNSSEIYIELKNSLDSLETKEDLKDFIDGLYLIRKSSLAKDGELGEGNLIFKQLRNEGILDELKTRLNELEDQELTLENLNESSTRGETSLRKVLEGLAGLLCDNYNPNVKYVLHHINEVHGDNTLTNLCLVPDREHRSYHSSTKNKEDARKNLEDKAVRIGEKLDSIINGEVERADKEAGEANGL